MVSFAALLLWNCHPQIMLPVAAAEVTVRAAKSFVISKEDRHLNIAPFHLERELAFAEFEDYRKDEEKSQDLNSSSGSKHHMEMTHVALATDLGHDHTSLSLFRDLQKASS
ncbi:hypothetical protein HGM15179_006821, partial [Zosterops borbonicus]